MKKKVVPLRRVLFFLLKLLVAVLVLLVIVGVFVVLNLRSITLDFVRSRYPDLIVDIQDAEFKFPCCVIAKGIYLQHVEDTSAASAIRIPRLFLKARGVLSRQITIQDLTLVDYTMTIDNSIPDSVLPFQAFTTETGRDEKPEKAQPTEKSRVVFEKIRINNGTLIITGANYDVRMRMNMRMRASVKHDEGFDLSGSLEDFLVVSYDFKTKPLRIDFETYLNRPGLEDAIPIKEMLLSVNGIPATASGELKSVKSGYKVDADVRLTSKSVRELLGLMEYQVPVVSDFDIDSPAELNARVVYDPDVEEFITVTGIANIAEGAAKSEYYDVELIDFEAVLPFDYRGSEFSYSWLIGGNVPDYDEGKIAAKGIGYDRYNAAGFSSMFSFDGTETKFDDLVFEAYHGKFQGSIGVVAGEKEFKTELRFDVDGLDMSELLAVYDQKTFDIGGAAGGTIELDLTDNYIENIAVNLKTEDGIFAIRDIGESLSALPGGDAVTDQLKKEMEKPEYWDMFVEAMRYYPYENGRIDVSFDSSGEGLVLLELWLKGKKPETGTKVFFPTVPITIGYHGIDSITDLFNIDQILGNMRKKN